MLYGGQVSESLQIFKQYCGDPNEPLAMNFFTITEIAACDAQKENVNFFIYHFKFI